MYLPLGYHNIKGYNERALRLTNEINEFTENLFNTVREPLLVLDKDLSVFNANRLLCNLFKVTPDQPNRNHYDLT